MKKLFILHLFFISFLSLAQDQYFSESGFEVRMPQIRNIEDFFYSEWELNPAEMPNKLSDMDALKKSTIQKNIRYEISNDKNGISTVNIYINNQIYSEASYKNGLLDGKKTIYHVKGGAFQEIEFKTGKANGVHKIYDENYQLVFESHYKDNLKHGSRKYTYPNRDNESLEGNYVNGNLVGNLKFTTKYDYYLLPNDLKKGKVQRFANNKLLSEFYVINQKEIHGEAKTYNFETGNLASKTPYYLGEKHGFTEYYNTIGELLFKKEYKFGKKVGEHKTYSKNNKLLKEEYYDAEGEKIGIWKTYTFNGELEQEQNYKNDSLNGISINYKYGKITSSTEFKNGKRHGLTVYNKDDNQKSSEVIFENGDLIKEMIYYQNGNIFSLQELNKETELYTTKYFNKQGKLLHENKYNDKKNPVGINKFFVLNADEPTSNSETHYDENSRKIKYITKIYGGTISETNYRNDKPHGEKITRNENNEIISIEYFYEEKYTSKKVTKEEFEKLIKAEKK
jgi:antitoxin component YwqK of YwqJK toxin-antitoxin module